MTNIFKVLTKKVENLKLTNKTFFPENLKISIFENFNKNGSKWNTLRQIKRVICKNAKRGRWGPKPTKFGPISCGVNRHQTSCGPVTEHFAIEGRTGIDISCKNNKCHVTCPEGKFSTLPPESAELICRNSRRNIWNVPKSTRVACVNVRKLEAADSLKCGPISEAYDWYKSSKIVARCSGLRRRLEKCSLFCENGKRPKDVPEAICNRKTGKFEPADLEEPQC